MDNKARSVSILVGVDGCNNRLLDDGTADTVQNNDNEASLHGEGSPAGSEEELNNNNSPTAIPVDEGDTITALKVGDSQGADETTVASPSNAINVTIDGGNTEQEDEEGDEGEDNQDEDDDDDVADDESDYSYQYEDDDGYSGFLIPTEPVMESSTTNNNNNSNSFAPLETGGTNAAASSESADGGGKKSALPRTISRAASGVSSPVPETNPQENERKQKWREPTRAAVNMSLRAEKEKTGGRRRLASDLYKIMMADTTEAGFSLEPADEDSMEKWRIKLFNFDEDSSLAKDLLVCNMDHVQLEMSFPDQYPFEPPFVRVVEPRFKRQTGFVMSGALCMELLTKDGWNPINDIESVIVSIRSLMTIGDGRVQAAADMKKDAYKKALEEARKKKKASPKGADGSPASSEEGDDIKVGETKRKRAPSDDENDSTSKKEAAPAKKSSGGSYSVSEAQSAYSHLTSYHKKEGWDKSGYWSRRG